MFKGRNEKKKKKKKNFTIPTPSDDRVTSKKNITVHRIDENGD